MRCYQIVDMYDVSTPFAHNNLDMYDVSAPFAHINLDMYDVSAPFAHINLDVYDVSAPFSHINLDMCDVSAPFALINLHNDTITEKTQGATGHHTMSNPSFLYDLSNHLQDHVWFLIFLHIQLCI